MTHRHKEEIQQHQTQIQELKSQVHRLESLLSKPPVDFNYPAAGARTCEELRISDKSLVSGLYWIDPDGLGTGDAPIHVFCNMTSGKYKYKPIVIDTLTFLNEVLLRLSELLQDRPRYYTTVNKQLTLATVGMLGVKQYNVFLFLKFSF